MLDDGERLSRGQAHSRDHRDQKISSSVLETISNELLRPRRHIAPDSFEAFLRDRKEVILADIYNTLNEKPAASFSDLVWLAVSRQGSSADLYACCQSD